MNATSEKSPLYQIFLKPPVDGTISDRIGWVKKVLPVDKVLKRFGSKPWVLLTGCFDGKQLTDGQLSLMQSLADIAPLVIGIESDETLRWNKGMFRPYLHQEERVARIAQRPEVSIVVPFDEEVIYNFGISTRSSHKLLQRFLRMRPPIVPIHADDPYNAQEWSMNGDAKRIHATRLVFEYYPAPSTSRLLGY